MYTHKNPMRLCTRALITHICPLATATATAAQRPPALVCRQKCLSICTRIQRVLSQEHNSPTYAPLPPPLPHNARLLYVCCQKSSMYTHKSRVFRVTRPLFIGLRSLANRTQRPMCVVKNSLMHTYTSQNSSVTSALFILLRPLANATATHNVRPLHVCCQKSRMYTQKSPVYMQTSPVTPCQEPCLSTNDPSQPPLPQNAQPLYACCQKSRACIVIRHKSLFVCKRSLTQEPYELYPRPLATATQRPPTLCVLSKEPYLHAKESKEPSLPACAPSPPPLPQPHNARLCYVCCQKGPIYTQKSPVKRALFTHLRPLATATATQRPPTLCVL